MSPIILNRRLFKRQLFRWNLGGHESNNIISGNNDKMVVNNGPKKVDEETLARKAGHQIGRVLEGGADLVVAPAKWIAHMQENWQVFYPFFLQ
jgi:hypothetical protein